MNLKHLNHLESLHYGIISLAEKSAGKVNYESWGDTQFKTFTRSIIKPIQAKVSLEALGEKIKPEFLDALKSKNADYILWSDREEQRNVELVA